MCAIPLSSIWLSEQCLNRASAPSQPNSGVPGSNHKPPLSLRLSPPLQPLTTNTTHSDCVWCFINALGDIVCSVTRLLVVIHKTRWRVTNGPIEQINEQIKPKSANSIWWKADVAGGTVVSWMAQHSIQRYECLIRHVSVAITWLLAYVNLERVH